MVAYVTVYSDPFLSVASSRPSNFLFYPENIGIVKMKKTVRWSGEDGSRSKDSFLHSHIY